MMGTERGRIKGFSPSPLFFLLGLSFVVVILRLWEAGVTVVVAVPTKSLKAIV